MTGVRDLLPENLKAAIRPFYRLFFNPITDKASSIAIGKFGGFELAYRQRTADEEVIAQTFPKDIFFAGVPEYTPSDDHVIIDIGAHIGAFAVFAASRLTRGQVHAVEASQDTFNILRINVALNGASNLFPYHLAIADQVGECTLYHDTRNWGHTVVTGLSTLTETVPCTTLAAFLDKNRIDKVHFMKLNCEGAEFPIILSSPKEVLQRFETILVLYHCDLWTKNTEADLVSHLTSSGFRVQIRNKDEKRGWLVATARGNTGQDA